MSATDLRIELVARRESAYAQPEHTLSVQSTLRWQPHGESNYPSASELEGPSHGR